ncbi:hypothetical protein SNE40_012389 [Patella caerulea]|uniref:SRCR domain-containing protein n=1 Tax=Patella caerulea TaxID=87958 RepID=A0AAN8JLS4_PATCE
MDTNGGCNVLLLCSVISTILLINVTNGLATPSWTERPDGVDGDSKVNATGEVLVLYNGIWGGVCGTNWDDVEAKVACTEAGFQNGKAYVTNFYDQATPAWVYEADCSGSEQELKECDLTRKVGGNRACPDRLGAMAYCYNDTDAIDYSLVGTGSNYGIVQVTRDGKTGYICGIGNLNNGEAGTVCRTLGFTDGDNYHTSVTTTYHEWWRGFFNCYQAPPFLHVCKGPDWEYITPSDSFATQECRLNTLSVYCYGTLRLHTKFANSSGVLLKRENRNYYAFCSDGFNMNSANAVCKDLGFIKARLILPASVYNTGYSVRFFNLECSVGATSMKQCTSVYNSSTTCHGGAAAVACDDGKSPIKDNLIEIAIDGTVQVSKNGIWGNINAYKWDNVEAQVLCKEKGFETGEMKQSIYSNKPRWMFDVDCQGDEDSIFSCPYKDLPDNATASFSGNARVFCYNRSDVNEYRLENGDRGRLIRNKDGQEGYACDFIRFYDQEATVVCKTLGYNRGERLESPSLPEGTKWWGVQLSCFYGSSTIESCKGSDWLYSYDRSLNYTSPEFDKCRNTSYAISVSCYGQVRLHDDSDNIGIALVRTGNNDMRAICADGFDLTDGDVACREIGYSGIRHVVAASTFSHLNYSILSYNFECVGGETSLLNCSYTNQTSCASRNYATIECVPNTTPSPTRRSTYPVSSNSPNYSKSTSNSNLSGSTSKPMSGNNTDSTDGISNTKGSTSKPTPGGPNNSTENNNNAGSINNHAVLRFWMFVGSLVVVLSSQI